MKDGYLKTFLEKIGGSFKERYKNIMKLKFVPNSELKKRSRRNNHSQLARKDLERS